MSSSRMTFMALVGRQVGQQRARARPPHRVRQLPLVAGAASGDTPWDDLAALGDEAAQAAHVLVVDDVDLVDAELADLPPAEPATFDGLGGRWNGGFLLERDVVFAGRRILGEGLSGWDGGGGAFGPAHELHALGDDLGDGALLTVLALPVTRLQAALDEDLAALVEVLAAALR